MFSVLETIYEDGSLTIQDLLMRLLERIAKRMTAIQRSSSGEDESDDEVQSEDDNEDAYSVEDYDLDDAEMFGVQSTGQTFDQSVLRRLILSHHRRYTAS